MSRPTTPPNTHDDPDYIRLLKLLHPQAPSATLRIEIIPSHHDLLTARRLEIGIPRGLLQSCYFDAQSTFEDHSTDPKYADKVLRATRIITLWDPACNTAWIYRRQRLISLRDHDEQSLDTSTVAHPHPPPHPPHTPTSTHPHPPPHPPQSTCQSTRIQEAVEAELSWVESLVQSPLQGRQAKFQYVWAHRRWIMKSFPIEVSKSLGSGCGCTAIEVSDRCHEDEVVRAWARMELVIVMISCEKHEKNDYAWAYARAIVRRSMRVLRDKRSLDECVGMLHIWCMEHARDISGWTFLLFLMENVVDAGGRRVIYWRTLAAVEEFKWTCESLEWFLKSARKLI